MLVSIITPAYNAEKFIADTIDSVLAQTYIQWEMIIVDDLSSDNTVKIVEEYIKKDTRLKLLRAEGRSGPAHVRNMAIEASHGRYIAFLDADDTWMPQKLEKQLALMKEHDLAFTYASYELMDEKSKSMGIFTTKNEITYESMLKTCSVGCLTAIYDVAKLGKKYMIAENLHKGEDYVLWLDIMKKIKKTKGLEEPLAKYRIQTTSLSSNKINAAKAQWHVYRNFERLNIFQSIYYLANYTYYGFIKYR